MNSELALISGRRSCYSSHLLSLVITGQPFIEWAEKEHVTKRSPLQQLDGRVIGIDASYFLWTLGPEGVLSALGGSPISLPARITAQVNKLRGAGLGLHFVFTGLDYGFKTDPFEAAAQSTNAVNEGFALYDASNSDEANRHLKHAGIEPSTFNVTSVDVVQPSRILQI